LDKEASIVRSAAGDDGMFDQRRMTPRALATGLVMVAAAPWVAA
jgi:hypothetical protein